MPKTRECSATERVEIYKRRKQSKSLQQIATEFGISKEGVRKICIKLNRIGKAENSIRTGRNRMTSARQDRQILKEAKKNPQRE